ncbi:hypothetical protein BGZ65_006674, partial [Modicella reniformis]
ALVDSKKLEEYGLMSGSVVHLSPKTGTTVTATGDASPAAQVPAEKNQPLPSDAPPTYAVAIGSTSVHSESTTAGATASGSRGTSQPMKPAVTSYRGLSEEGTAIAKEAEFWYWLNDQLKEKLGSKEDAASMVKGFVGQYRDLIGNAGTKEIEKEIKK